MTELEKIAYAKTYIEKLANGINPLTDQPVPDSDSINNALAPALAVNPSNSRGLNSGLLSSSHNPKNSSTSRLRIQF